MAIGKPNKITLDLYLNKHVFTRVAQYDIDSREINIKITDKGVPFPIDPSEYAVRIEYFKSDRTSILDDIPVENILPDGTIKLVLSEQMCASWGKNEARLLLSSITTKEIVHTMHFDVIVDKSVIDNVSVTSSDEYKSFENALVEFDTVVGDFSSTVDNLNKHIIDTSNPHDVTKAQIGLENVDNTSDVDKPISKATQTELNGKAQKNHASLEKNYGIGNSMYYGHVKVSNNFDKYVGDATSGVAASQASVYELYQRSNFHLIGNFIPSDGNVSVDGVCTFTLSKPISLYDLLIIESNFNIVSNKSIPQPLIMTPTFFINATTTEISARYYVSEGTSYTWVDLSTTLTYVDDTTIAVQQRVMNSFTNIKIIGITFNLENITQY